MTKFLGFITSLSVLALPALVSAGNSSFTTENLKETIEGLRDVVNVSLVVLGGVAVLVFIWGIIRFVLSSADAEKRADAKHYMIYGVIAFAVIVGLFGLANGVLSFIGIDSEQDFQIPQIQE